MLITIAGTIALAIRVARLQAIDSGSWLPLLSAGILAGGPRLALMTAIVTRLKRSATMVAAMRATCRG
jgi:hypothetical protein